MNPNFYISKTAMIWTKWSGNTWYVYCIEIHSAFQEEEIMAEMQKKTSNMMVLLCSRENVIMALLTLLSHSRTHC